jgi:predicted nucleic acid-binding protein
MSGKFFLDTNIFVYSFDASSPKKAAQATKLIRKGIETRGGIVSYQVVQEFFNVALRRFAKPMNSLGACPKIDFLKTDPSREAPI